MTVRPLYSFYHHLRRKTSTRTKMPSAWVCIPLFLACIYSPALATDEAELSCNSLYTPAQREMCRDIPDLLKILQAAEQQALIECERVFVNQPWNCSDFSVLIPSVVMKYATKESAFMYGIMSASIAHITAKLCATEDHSLPCSCSDENITFHVPNSKTEILSGCSYDIEYGVELARRFMDSFDIFSSDAEKFSLHNNRVGRLVLQNSTITSCICHGVSAGCTLQTCHLELESFAFITQQLFNLYKKSCKVRSNGKFGEDHAYETECGLTLGKTDLIYFEESPDYCIKDLSKGSPGVKGRACNPHTQGEGSCSQTCCGRGYEAVKVEFTEPCMCHFQWCCEVICDECHWDETRYFCL